MTEVNKKKPEQATPTVAIINTAKVSRSNFIFYDQSAALWCLPLSAPPARTPPRRRHQTARQALYTANMAKLPTHSRYCLLGNFYYYVMTAYYWKGFHSIQQQQRHTKLGFWHAIFQSCLLQSTLQEEEHYCQMSTLPLQWTKDSSSSKTEPVEHIQNWLGQSLNLLDLAGMYPNLWWNIMLAFTSRLTIKWTIMAKFWLERIPQPSL